MTIDGATVETYKGTKDLSVAGNLTETVTGVNNITVGGNLSETVTGTRTALVGGQLTETVTGKSELHVYSTQASKIEVGGDFVIKTTQGNKDIKLSTLGTGKTHITNTTNITAKTISKNKGKALFAIYPISLLAIP